MRVHRLMMLTGNCWLAVRRFAPRSHSSAGMECRVDAAQERQLAMAGLLALLLGLMVEVAEMLLEEAKGAAVPSMPEAVATETAAVIAVGVMLMQVEASGLPRTLAAVPACASPPGAPVRGGGRAHARACV